jgi:hypothetical protein
LFAEVLPSSDWSLLAIDTIDGHDVAGRGTHKTIAQLKRAVGVDRTVKIVRENPRVFAGIADRTIALAVKTDRAFVEECGAKARLFRNQRFCLARS